MAMPKTPAVYRRILVPMDLSELTALAHACALIAPERTIHLAHD